MGHVHYVSQTVLRTSRVMEQRKCLVPETPDVVGIPLSTVEGCGRCTIVIGGGMW